MPEPRFTLNTKDDDIIPVLEQVADDREMILEFSRRHNAETIAEEILASPENTDEFENIGRDLDHRVQNFGGFFFFQLFLDKIKEGINSTGAKDVDGREINFADRKSMLVYLSVQRNAVDLFLSAIDDIVTLTPLQKARFTSRLRNLSLGAFHNKETITIDNIETAILDVGSNIFIEECYPED